jgi:hypothetical protein
MEQLDIPYKVSTMALAALLFFWRLWIISEVAASSAI